MKQWVGLGKFLAGHMQFIVPICVALGVLFPQQIGVLKPIVPTLFAFMTFQGALSNTFRQVTEVFRRPLHLILALFVSAVLIPIAAYAMGSLFFGSNPNLVCGIVLEYSVPVAVTAFMWISMFGGNGPLALTIILTSSVISPVTIPLTLKLLLGATVSIDVPSMMQNMAFMIAIPAALGIVINELTRGWGHEKLSPALSPACKFMMMGVIASNSTAMSEYVLHMNAVRLEVALFILVFAISGFVVGFWSHVRCICHIARRLPCALPAACVTSLRAPSSPRSTFRARSCSPSCAARCFSRCWPRLSGISLSA